MDNRQAMITGATRGIGKAIAIQLAKDGFDIAFTYRNDLEEAKKLVDILKDAGSQNVKYYEADIANTEQLKQAMDLILSDFPKMEVLVNNAGITIDNLIVRYKIEDFDKIIATNVRSGFVTSQAVIKPMMKQRKGSIIFISSVIGQMGNAGQVAYSTTKSALFGMTKSLAKEVGSRGIRINAIAPGFIQTAMTDNLPEANKKALLDQIPLGYLGTPDDIAGVVSFLCSPKGSYITGQVIAVNGGLYM